MAQQNKLFLVQLKDWPLPDRRYDSYNEFVICCATEIDARDTHPQGSLFHKIGLGWDAYSWIEKDLVYSDALTVTFLGFADEKIQPGIISTSFNAG
jgi:hypothetical protein